MWDLATRFPSGIRTRPVLELIGIKFAGQIGQLELQTCLGVGDGAVVDGGADLFENEIEQQTGGHIADGLGEILFEVALERCNGVGALLLGEFDAGHHAVMSLHSGVGVYPQEMPAPLDRLLILIHAILIQGCPPLALSTFGWIREPDGPS